MDFQELKGKVKEQLYISNRFDYWYQDPEARVDKKLVEYFKKEYKIKTDVHRSCINCQMRQIVKYKHHVDESRQKERDEGKPVNPLDFRVKCKFIPRGLPGLNQSRVLEEAARLEIHPADAKRMLLSSIDPVAWAELMFGFDDENIGTENEWAIRNYQKEQMRCSAQRLVLRQGRRSGKTFSVCLKIVYYVFNLLIKKGKTKNGKPITKGPEIIVVTPFQTQLDTIFRQIEELILRNEELKAMVISGSGDSLFTKNPNYRMRFHNKGLISGFVSGTAVKGDGSSGGTIRSASPDVIYMDEIDMIPDEIIDNAINALLLTTPNVILMASSTPIGKRGKFYNYSKENPLYKEDYYPSTILPHWHEMEEELLAGTSEEGFKAEFMADFVEGGHGVFRPSWVIEASRDYTYANLTNKKLRELGIRDPRKMIISIGIDWNKNAGTEYFVAGYSPKSGLWVALESINISSSKQSAQRWMEELIRLNYKWKPDYIYADEGYGHHIIEDLQYYAHRLKAKSNKTDMEIETAKLEEKLVSFNFSSNVEIRSPIDRKIIKKSGKHFIVENAARIFESRQMLIPYSDEKLRKQMLNYIVERRNPSNNKPVYGMDNHKIGDHKLDAMMLSLAGIAIESSIYANGVTTFSFGDPAAVSREELEGRDENTFYMHPNEEAKELGKEFVKAGFPSAFEILALVRGNGSAEADQRAREEMGLHHWNKSRKENTGTRYDPLTVQRTRGAFTKPKQSSILESIANQNNDYRPDSSMFGNPKRGRKGRRIW